MGAALALVAVLAFALWPRLGDDAGAVGEVQRLVVLPLADQSPDADDAYFAAGLTEELTSRLSRLGGLHVVSASATRALADERPAAIRDALGAQAVLEGSARVAGDRARVSVRLVSTETEAALWAETFDVDVGDALAVQAEVAERVAEALALEVRAADRARLARGGTDDPEAFRIVLRARHAWADRSPDGLRRARALFEDAIDRDPAYASAWAGLANVYVTMIGYGLVPADAGYPRARAAARRALDIAPDVAEAHVALAAAAFYDWDWVAVDRHYRAAIARDPLDATALAWYSEFLAFHGHTDDALALARRAQAADPFSLLAHADEGRVYYYTGQDERAAAHFEETLARGPNFVASLYLGALRLRAGRADEAVEVFEAARDTFGYPDFTAFLVGAYTAAGREADARRLLGEVLDLRRAGRASAIVVATAYLGRGDHPRALDWLEQAYEERDWQMVFLQTEPVFDPLRSEPRFQAIVRRVGTLEKT